MEEQAPVTVCTEEAAATPKKKKRRAGPLLLVLLLLAAIASGVVIYRWYLTRNQPETTRLQREKDSIMGILPGKTDAEIGDILGTVVEEGMVNVTISQMPIFHDGGKRGKLGVQNIPGNHYSYQVEITLDEGGESVYKSNLIPPGYYLDEVALNRTLAAGTYNATAVFSVYSVEDDADVQIAQVNANLVLAVFE